MRAQLEEEEEHVEEQQDDGCAARQGEDGRLLGLVVGRVVDGTVELLEEEDVRKGNGKKDTEKKKKSLRKLTVAGIIRDAMDKAMSEQLVWAVTVAKLCSMGRLSRSRMFQMPPSKKHMPSTSSRFDRMDPNMDDCTTSIWPWRSATMLTISSTALPKVALSRPPMESPRRTEISSVAKDNTAASGMMAKKLSVNTVAALQPREPATMPMGTKTSSTLTGLE